MKNLHLLTWLTQLGLSVAIPLAGFILLAVWLKNRFGWGNWVLFVGIGLGLFCAIDGFLKNLRLLDKLNNEKDSEKPPIAFDTHD